VKLTWRAPFFDGGFPITEYRVYKGETPDDMELLAVLGPVYNFTDSNITRDKIYYYQVSAVNVHGESERTGEALVRTDEAWTGGGSTVQRIMDFWWLYLMIGLILSGLITLIGYAFVRNKETWLIDGKPQFNVIYRDIVDRAKRKEEHEQGKDK
jgi:hypothetical protein